MSRLVHVRYQDETERVRSDLNGSLNLYAIAKLFSVELDPLTVKLDRVSEAFNPETGFTVVPVVGGETADNPIVVTGKLKAGSENRGGAGETSVSALDVIRAGYRHPAMQCVSRSTQRRDYPEAIIRKWMISKEEVMQYSQQHLENLRLSATEILYSADPNEVHNTEASLNIWYASAVGKVVCGVLKHLLGHGFGNITFMVENCRGALLGKPDFTVTLGDEVVCGGEGKTPTVLSCCHSLLDSDDLTFMRKPLEQTCSYFRDGGWPVGFLTCGTATYFIRREGLHEYAITNAFYHDSTEPSTREVLFYILHKVLAFKIGMGPRRVRGVTSQHREGPFGYGEFKPFGYGNFIPRETQGNSGGAPRQSGSRTNRMRPISVDSEYVHPLDALELSKETLGAGETGDVLWGRCYDRPSAVKLADVCKDKVLVQALQHEARVYDLLRPLQGHCIPNFHGCGFWHFGALYFLATSVVSGSHPSSWCRSALPVAEKALAAIHQLGVLHGDICTDNILVEEAEGTYKVWFLDFGQSKVGPSEAECAKELVDLRYVFRASDQSNISESSWMVVEEQR